jgi:hypothetical protein
MSITSSLLKMGWGYCRIRPTLSLGLPVLLTKATRSSAIIFLWDHGELNAHFNRMDLEKAYAQPTGPHQKVYAARIWAFQLTVRPIQPES